VSAARGRVRGGGEQVVPCGWSKLQVTALRALSAAAAVWPLLAQDYSTLRRNMVRDQIERRGVRNPAVLDAMRTVPRHLFVPKGLQNAAYDDSPLPIGFDQTISQPYIVGAMTQMLEVTPRDRVLEIGTGSGYQAAILSRLAKEVYSIELVPQLARSSAALLRDLGFLNVTVKQGDGYLGWPEKAPFDRIILTAAPPEIPPALIEQLGRGGRLVAPEGVSYQELVIIRKDASGVVRRETSFAVRFVPMVPGSK